jgi:hypothetical protein
MSDIYDSFWENRSAFLVGQQRFVLAYLKDSSLDSTRFAWGSDVSDAAFNARGVFNGDRLLETLDAVGECLRRMKMEYTVAETFQDRTCRAFRIVCPWPVVDRYVEPKYGVIEVDPLEAELREAMGT